MTMTNDPFPDVPDMDLDPDRYSGDRSKAAKRGYEDSAVRYVCNCLALPGLARTIAAVANERLGRPQCNFPLFDEVAHFPTALRVGKLRRVRFVTLPDLFNAFPKTPIGYALADVADDVGIDRDIGLIFKWVGRDDGTRNTAIKGGKFMIAHTAASGLGVGRVKIMASMPLAGVAADVTVEPLDAFLALYRGWSPAD